MKSSALSAKILFSVFSIRYLLFGLLLLSSGIAHSQDRPFITTWKTDNEGASNSTSIRIQTISGDVYNYDVDWDNDGNYDQLGITGNVTHDFGTAGTYTIRIRGIFPGVTFISNPNDAKKLLDIVQWGDISWSSMRYAFPGASNLQISATDVPDISAVTDMTNMFSNCTILNGPANIGSWDTRNVTTLTGAFRDTYAFNQPLGDWNTSNVTTMDYMFLNAKAFNQPVGDWDTGKLTSTEAMFFGASVFNQPLSGWNTENVTKMSAMFYNASSFNQPIGNWDTGNVQTMAMMFASLDASGSPVPPERYDFNQPIGNWNTANVIDFRAMFYNAVDFNQPLGNWTLNQSAYLDRMLDNSGLSPANYELTLQEWSDNPLTPDGRLLGAVGLKYGAGAVAARNNLTSSKGWTISGDELQVLPVTLISFTGKKQDNHILLEWKTTSERNNAGFYIEKSSNGKTFERIGFVDGKGDSQELNSYLFTDSAPFSMNYYRLNQIDRAANDGSGKSEYSRIISVKGPAIRLVFILILPKTIFILATKLDITRYSFQT
jgi:surface protein